MEFAWTREAAGDFVAHIYSAMDINPLRWEKPHREEAHVFGMELAGAVLGGKYEFVFGQLTSIKTICIIT